MEVTKARTTSNFLLDALSDADRGALEQHVERIPLPLQMRIYEPNESISDVYFPIDAVISMVSTMETGTVEVATVGCEGMAGLPVLLHSDSMPTRAFVQVAGEGMRMSAASFREALDASPVFARIMYRYAQALFDQVAQSVACNRLHVLEERCARWILMTQDRVRTPRVHLKQQFLAEMLGVHRPAVTLAAGALQKAGLIRYSRGVIEVLDRTGLEAAACCCYAVVRRSFDRLRAVGGR